MKPEITIHNYKTGKSQKYSDGANEFSVIPVVAQEDAKQCTVSFVIVAPNNYAYGYHYHEMNEEVFYIISGEGMVRTEQGELSVKSGDVITFPSGKAGAHVIRNASATDQLVYIDFDTHNNPEIVHLLDIHKLMVNGPFSSGLYEETD